MERERLTAGHGGGSYLAAPTDVEVFSSGCVLLDRVLGGGWAVGRVANVVGDKSTGKTLLAIEAMVNFSRAYQDGDIRYREVEAAFDKGYAQMLGLPLDRIDFGTKPCFTVEDVFEDMAEFVAKVNKRRKGRGYYILDSLDALSDRAELERDIKDETYGGSKPKKLSELFRRLTQKLEASNTTVLVISQVRDNIGVTFGERHMRTGGKALDFYASQIIWLSQLGKIAKTRRGVERTVGINVKARCKKNKVGMPFRDCQFPLMFAYGVEDVVASVEWLIEVKRTKDGGFKSIEDAKAYLKALHTLEDEEYHKERRSLAKAVTRVWMDIEEEFMPKRSKYGRA